MIWIITSIIVYIIGIFITAYFYWMISINKSKRLNSTTDLSEQGVVSIFWPISLVVFIIYILFSMIPTTFNKLNEMFAKRTSDTKEKIVFYFVACIVVVIISQSIAYLLYKLLQ